MYRKAGLRPRRLSLNAAEARNQGAQIKSRRGRSPDLRRRVCGLTVGHPWAIALRVRGSRRRTTRLLQDPARPSSARRHDPHALQVRRTVGDVGPDQERLAVACHQLREAGAARSEEHTSELQSLMRISYAVFCLKKKNKLYI